MRIFANIISSIFHPLLMITYGVILALIFTYLNVFPIGVKLYLVVGAFLTTALIPGIFIYMMVRNGTAVDLELSDRHERLLPYIIIICSVLLCTFFMYKLSMPFWFVALLLGSAVSLIIAMGINFFWKISAHTLAVGGLLGGIVGVARIHLMNPYIAIMIVVIIGGLVAASRIYLEKHTPMQVYAGFALGFLCTFMASFLSYIYLFI